LLSVVGITMFAASSIQGADTPRVFYTHTSGPPPGDGFVWGNGDPEHDLPHGDTFETPDLSVKYGNFTGWPTYFNAYYFDALGNDLEQSGHIDRAAWWGTTGSQNPELNLRFTDTPTGGIESLSFSLAWATLLPPPDTVRVRINDYLIVPGGPTLEATLEVTLPDAFMSHMYSQGRAGRVELDFRSLVDDRSGAPFTQIEDVWIELDAISAGPGFGNIVAIDNVSINQTPGLEGDYNRDGAVDAADYVVWRKNDGTQPGYDLWRTNFGRTAGSGSTGATPSPAAIPEPAAFFMAFTALLAGVCRRREAVVPFQSESRAGVPCSSTRESP
jgi:hypothetical protein